MKFNTNPDLNYISANAIELFEEQGKNAVYIEDKLEDLKGLTKFETLIWCNNLDAENIALLAKKLCIPEDDFVITIQTLRLL